MPIDQLALLVALVIAANLVLLVALELPRLGRRRDRAPAEVADAFDAGLEGRVPATAEEPDGAPAAGRFFGAPGGLTTALYQRVVRVVSFMFIVAVLVVASLTGAVDQTGIFLLLAVGMFLIVLFGDVLPPRALGRLRRPIEAVATIGFLTILLMLTGGHESPYFLGFILLLSAASVASAGIGQAVLAVVTSAAYIGAVVAVAGPGPLTPAELGRVAFNLVAFSLITYVAGVIGREQRRAREEALRLSRFDALTGMYSRLYFLEEVEQEILRAARSRRPFALLMLDLDGLKAANDRFGHESGDQLLRAVADVVRGDIRSTDVAARYGGDEFVLVLPETDLAGAMLVADKLRVDISRLALPHNGNLIRTSVSIGLVTFPDEGRTSAELLRRADLAMYEAKRRGRDQIVRYARQVTVPMDVGDGSGPLPGPGVGVGPPPAPGAPAPESSIPAESPGPAPWQSTTATAEGRAGRPL